MKVIQTLKVEYVTLNVSVQYIPDIAQALYKGAEQFSRPFYKSRLTSLAAYFEGYEDLAVKAAQTKPDADFKIKLSVDAFRLLLRALRTRLNQAEKVSFFNAQKWIAIYYNLRGQVDKSIWKQALTL